MRSITVLLILFCCTLTRGQVNKGFAIQKDIEKVEQPGKTYALIVGISKYQNASIPSLQYADKDALAFRDYLIASGVDSNNISLRLNEKATYSEILIEIDEICTAKAQPGDKVFI